MKTIFILIATLMQISIASAQKKPAPPVKKTTTPTKPEIDKLADKYKDASDITLFTSHGDLTGYVSINTNVDDKPESVEISGNSTNMDAVAEFISMVIAQKERQGYEVADGNYFTNAENVRINLEHNLEINFLFKKRNMYFIVKGWQQTFNNDKFQSIGKDNTGKDIGFTTYDRTTVYYFSIETGDNSRKGGKKATKFEF